MNSVNYHKSLLVLVTMALCSFVYAATAQIADDDEELRPIIIGHDEDMDTEDNGEEIDEPSSYRLIESDEGDDWVEPPPQTEVDADELSGLFELYREAMENKAYLEADTLAKQVVEMSIKLNGLDSHDSARAITNLGIAQHNNRDYQSAMLNFSASIGIVERIDDRLSPALINPLQGLAATQAATGRPDLAKKSYQRAVHVSHVNSGPHNPSQVETLTSMAELNISMGDLEEAAAIQENIFELEARNIDPRSLDIVPALHHKAEWQHRLQQFQAERLTWRQVISVIEGQVGKDSLDLIPPLTNLGRSYLFVSPAEYDYRPEVSSTSGETYLRRANRIADTNPDSNWKLVEDTLLALGDYYILSGRPNRAEKVYEDAWTMLSEGNDAERRRARWEHLEQVNVLQTVFPDRYYNSERTDIGLPPPENFETGTITFEFNVTPSGRVSNLAILETTPEELQDFSESVERNLRRLIYRPRLVEGRLVSTERVTYTHEFFYRPSDLPSNKTTPTTGETGAPAPSSNEDR